MTRISIWAMGLFLLPLAVQACSDGARAQAYDLGHSHGLQGLSTLPAPAHLPQSHSNCYLIGQREGQLQRMLRVAQPHPPAARLRPRPTG